MPPGKNASWKKCLPIFGRLGKKCLLSPDTGDYKIPCVRACVRSSRFYKSLSISYNIIARASKFAG